MDRKLNCNQVIIGINWGAIFERGWFESEQRVGVDLDLCCFLLDSDQNTKEILNWENSSSIWGSISNDDMEGDMEGNDQKDNEWLTLNLNQVNNNFELHISISNYSEKSLRKLSHFDYRIYTGHPNEVNKSFYFKDLKHSNLNDTSKGVYLGRIKKIDGIWQFSTMETQLEACDAGQQIEQILSIVTK
ncbi:TerD family protein [Pseudotamlana agarivorans]|uniref:TerD family protein n=1 Tax=Pseudotamlana agarivorans TaxID=481183 RepID=UPI00082B56F3|nr:TerD family protein [Tamlana agarivorans]